MPGFKRTRSKVHNTDSESDESPTIGNRSNKRNKPLGNPPATHYELRNFSQKLAVYIVAAKLGTNRTVADLSDLVRGSTYFTLAKNAEEADVVVTGVGMRKRLERSIPAELIVSFRCHTLYLVKVQCQPPPKDQKPIVKPEWLEKSIKEGKPQSYNRYRALNITQGEAADDVGISNDRGDDSTRDGWEITTSAQVDLRPNAKFACQRNSPLVCPNQELVKQIDVIKRARELDMDWQGALSYARAIAVGSPELHHVYQANTSSLLKVWSSEVNPDSPNKSSSVPQENQIGERSQ